MLGRFVLGLFEKRLDFSQQILVFRVEINLIGKV